MPELPEVETVKNTLKELIVGKKIDTVEVRWANIIKRPDDVHKFNLLLQGQTFTDVRRRGKFLVFVLDEFVIVSHLRMEGKYRLELTPDTPVDKHTHVMFHFTDGTSLHYNDVRKFGTMHLFNKGEELSFPPLGNLGPEPMDTEVTAEWLAVLFQKTERLIKPVLLDQSKLVGLGNIYVDEALFQAGIHPEAKAKLIPPTKLVDLIEAIRQTLQEAIDAGGSSIRSYLNGNGEMGRFQQRLFVYGREGTPCKQCSSIIEKTKVGGRGTHFCSTCQEEWS